MPDISMSISEEPKDPTVEKIANRVIELVKEGMSRPLALKTAMREAKEGKFGEDAGVKMTETDAIDNGDIYEDEEMVTATEPVEGDDGVLEEETEEEDMPTSMMRKIAGMKKR